MRSTEFPVLVTKRLELRGLVLQHVGAVFQHFSNEEVTRFMDISPCKNLSEAERIIRFHLQDPGHRWGVFEKGTQQLIGTCGYHCWRNYGELGAVAEIGFDLDPAHWGQGCMAEALRPVIHFGFEGMGLSAIEASVDPQNVRSIKLLERLGFQHAGCGEEGLLQFYLYRQAEMNVS